MKFLNTCFFSILFLSASAIQIDGVILKTTQDVFPAQVYIWNYSLLDNKSVTDTALVTANGTYQFRLPIQQNGLYQLKVGSEVYSILLTLKEANIKITNTLNDKSKIWIENSPENEAYKMYTDFNSFYIPQYMSLYRSYDVDSMDTELKSFYRDYFSGLNQVVAKYPESYTVKNFVKMRQFATIEEIVAQKKVRPFLQANFWKNFSWNNPELLNEGTFDDCFMSYSVFMVDTGLAPFQQYYDKYISGNKTIHPDVFRFAQTRLFHFLMQMNNEARLTYLVKKSLADERMQGLGLKWQLEMVSRVLPGNAYIPVTGIAQDGSSIALAEMVAKNKLTMLMFYSPDCSHCRESMPDIKRLYDNYRPKGLGIYAVSIMDDKPKWEQMIAQSQMNNWTNVQMKHEAGKRDAASEYFLTSTPTFVLIDSKGTIIHRFISTGGLELAFKTYL